MEELVRRTRPRLTKMARRIGAPQDAEDSVQASYHALLRLGSVPDAPIFPWLVTTVVRVAYRKKATALRQRALAERLARPQDAVTPPQQALADERARLVRRGVAQLPDRYRHPLILYHLEGLTVRETAALLGVADSTVTTRLQRGRSLLRSRLGATFALGACAVPWVLMDGWQWAAPYASIGGAAVKAKTAVALASVGLTAGALGIVVGATSWATPASANGRAPRDDPGAVRDVARLTATVRARDAEITKLRARVANVESEAESGAAKRTNGLRTGRGDLASAAQAAAMAMFVTRISMEDARASAHRLGVTEEELAVSLDLFNAIRNDADPVVKQAMKDRFAELGDRRVSAATALLRGIDAKGPEVVTAMQHFVNAAHVESQAQHWVDTLADHMTPGTTKLRLIESLSSVKSATVHAYLVERVAREEDPYVFGSILSHLGDLKDDRLVPHASRALASGKNKPHRYYWLHALAKLGGDRAKRALIEHLHRPPDSDTLHAIEALERIDKRAAQQEARRLIHETNLKALSKADKEKLKTKAN